MEFLKDFGFDPVLFVAQIINFVIIFFLLKKILYKPVLDILSKRDSEIKKGLKDKEEAEKLLAEAEVKESEIIKNAQTKAEKIISDAKLEATDTRTQIEEQARKEAERMITQSRETIDHETKLAEEYLTKKIGNIAIGVLEKSLTGLFGKREQQEILKKAESALKKHHSL